MVREGGGKVRRWLHRRRCLLVVERRAHWAIISRQFENHESCDVPLEEPGTSGSCLGWRSLLLGRSSGLGKGGEESAGMHQARR